MDYSIYDDSSYEEETCDVLKHFDINEEKKILNGFPWIYANEVSSIEGKDLQGSIAKVVSFDRRFVGYGYINHASKIIVRIVSYNEEEIDDFDTTIYNRIKEANDRRIAMGYDGELSSYRAVFSESDLLPGLVVDKYGDYLSIQILTLGMEVRKKAIIDSLIKVFRPLGIYERSDVAVREKEGLKQFKGIVYGNFNPVVEIIENGLRLRVDLENGQKTGYFLDQKSNRDNVKHYVKDKDVLDCFCNVGGFSLCAAMYGAKSVTAVDISKTAIDEVLANAKLNNLKINTVCADVFEKLREYKKEGKKFDVIILDPPAFTKSIDTVKEGYKGYVDINVLGLKLLKKGGTLITCSCSQHLTMPLFMRMIEESCNYSGVKTRLVELRFQGKDHAMMTNLTESLYLKVAVLNVL